MTEHEILEQHLQEFHAALLAKERSPITIRGYLSDVRLFSAWFASMYTEPLSFESLTVAAVRAYNVEISAGQFGGAPALPGQRLNASILVQSLLVTPEEFAAVPIRTNADGSLCLLSTSPSPRDRTRYRMPPSA